MGSFQGGLLEGAETVVCTKSGPPRGDVSSTCLDLIRSKLCVGGREREHTDAGSQILQMGTSQTLRGQPYRYGFVICGGHDLKYHIGHSVF